MAIDAQELVDTLEQEGFYPKAYSGRAMFGKECVSVNLDSEAELWELAYNLGVSGAKVGPPCTDSMALGIVAYWPSVAWPQ